MKHTPLQSPCSTVQVKVRAPCYISLIQIHFPDIQDTKANSVPDYRYEQGAGNYLFSLPPAKD